MNENEEKNIGDDLENCTKLFAKTNQLKKHKDEDETLLKETKKKLQLIQKEYDLLLSTTMTRKQNNSILILQVIKLVMIIIVTILRKLKVVYVKILLNGDYHHLYLNVFVGMVKYTEELMK